jgi:hypothetical protein
VLEALARHPGVAVVDLCPGGRGAPGSDGVDAVGGPAAWAALTHTLARLPHLRTLRWRRTHVGVSLPVPAVPAHVVDLPYG